MFCGLHIDSGRIGGTTKKTLRAIIEKYNLDVRLTPNQNIILTNINRAWRKPISTSLAEAGILVITNIFILMKVRFRSHYN